MGNKHSRRSNVHYPRRDSAPDGRMRRSLWLQRGRLSAPCERAFDVPKRGQPSLAPASLPKSTHRTTADSRSLLHIRVTNLRQHEKLSFPLVSLEGHVDNLETTKLPDSALYIQTVAHAADQSDNNAWVGSVCWPVVRESGHFKAYVHLAHPGVFYIRLRIGSATHQLTVRFAPRRTKWVVRFHYQKPRDSYQGFDAPTGVDNSDSDACQRLKFNALVLQTTVAELFHRAGFSRKTFAVELDRDGFPVVDVLRSKHSIKQARQMTDSQLLAQLNEDVKRSEELKEELGTDKSSQLYRIKHVVLLGGSHFDPRTHRLTDYRALVGGNVVATSSCGLFTWPRGLNELTSCCFNSGSVAPEFVMDQRSVHQSYWANYSGGISVLLHLMGLCFGLKYRPDGVMHRRFRQATRLLTVMEPRSGNQQGVAIGQPIGDGRFDKLQRQAFRPVGAATEEIYLDELSIGMLAIQCRWINPNSMRNVAKETPASAA
ncbi:hypothetical protein PHYSODRAFT_292954 [Phytophthora sojae]|uniref:Uncharacterized protein n=1 Tax=Phytophthora sojae (strain P6497) TaxID=1094619 RepID=G4YLQ4_PHYSP|nr:hypothetical protein PHYSODRAFT_292954 [Phytophthora sojae]EGZ26674.1 hypothetical protein PHYSODRAFT_292954 [Phytophthora sojae]|eukprot:XP_009513949.1 hypothetical protein PHYSODRAFT_292954 [Phytophthora sojae]